MRDLLHCDTKFWQISILSDFYFITQAGISFFAAQFIECYWIVITVTFCTIIMV